MDLGTLDHTNVKPEQRRFVLVAIAFSIVAALSALDLVDDLQEGTTLRHIFTESIVVAIAAAGTAFVVNRIIVLGQLQHEAARETAELVNRLQDSRAEAEQWRAEAQELLQGLGAMIDRQFGRWGLSKAEREVALLVLKGFTHKEIAVLRKVGGATVRQQAAAIYKKAGVSGRHDLSAFFLEDLLAPKVVSGDGKSAGRG